MLIEQTNSVDYIIYMLYYLSNTTSNSYRKYLSTSKTFKNTISKDLK